MNDRELLELAAKAAKLEDYENDLGRGPIYRKHHTGLQDWVRWNPLDDDGDAFRLAVKLNLLTTECVEDWKWCRDKTEHAEVCASYRRAIVRAAAEIGRAMNDRIEELAEHLERYATFGRGDRSHEAAGLLREQHAEIERLRGAPQPEPAAMFDERVGHPVLLPGAPMFEDGQFLYATTPAAAPDDVEALRAEIERLRRVLRGIETLKVTMDGVPAGAYQTEGWMRELAREALEGKT